MSPFIFFFHHVVPSDTTLVFRFSSKCFYPLSHPIGFEQKLLSKEK